MKPSERAVARATDKYLRFGIALSDSGLFEKVERVLEAGYQVDVEQLEFENTQLRKALMRILAWEMPQCVVENCPCGNTPSSYGWHRGSNGERDYVRGLARLVLGIDWTQAQRTDDPEGV